MENTAETVIAGATTGAAAGTIRTASEAEPAIDLARLNELESRGFLGYCGIRCIEADRDHAIYVMPVIDELRQPFGFLHGGATISLLESAASCCAALRKADDEVVFGVNINITHRNPGREGVITGVATLDREEERGEGKGRKQFWAVRATDEAGTLISEGSVMTIVMPASRFAAKEESRPKER